MIIRNIPWAAIQLIRINSEGSCDTKDVAQKIDIMTIKYFRIWNSNTNCGYLRNWSTSAGMENTF